MSETEALQQALGAFQSMQTSASPALGDVLSAYRLKGDGDREMLLAVLNAKAAEDQRAAAVAQLHHSILQAAYTNAMLVVAQQQQQQPQQSQQHSHYHPYASPRSEASPRMNERPSKRRRDSSSTNTTTTTNSPLSNSVLGGTRLPPIMSISSITSPIHKATYPTRMDVEDSHLRSQRPHHQQQQRSENTRAYSYPHSPPGSTGSNSDRSPTMMHDSETRRSLERLSAERSTS